MKPAHKDIDTPPGQIINDEYKLLAFEAKSIPKAKTLGDIINKICRSDSPSVSIKETDELKKAIQTARSEGYTQGYYDGVIDEHYRRLYYPSNRFLPSKEKS